MAERNRCTWKGRHRSGIPVVPRRVWHTINVTWDLKRTAWEKRVINPTRKWMEEFWLIDSLLKLFAPTRAQWRFVRPVRCPESFTSWAASREAKIKWVFSSSCRSDEWNGVRGNLCQRSSAFLHSSVGGTENWKGGFEPRAASTAVGFFGSCF